MARPDRALPPRRLTSQEVRRSANSRLEEIAADHTELRRAGRQSKGLCPLHDERTPPFFVDADKQLWKCFGCGVGGDAITLVQQLYRVDFRQAVAYLVARFGRPPAIHTAGGEGSF